MRPIDADAFTQWVVENVPSDMEGALIVKALVCVGLTTKSISPTVNVNSWISVRDRLPNTYQHVITYDKYSGVKENWLLKSNPCVSWSQGFHITHWMPLPEPPEVEK